MKHIHIPTSILLLVTLGTGSAYYILRKQAIRAQEELLTEKLNNKLIEIEEHVNQIITTAQNASKSPDIRALVSQTITTTNISDLLKKHECVALSLFTPESSLVFSTEEQPFAHYREHIMRAVRTTGLTLKTQMSDLYYDSSHKCPVFLIVVPVIDAERVLGIMAIEKKDPSFNTLIGQMGNDQASEEIVLGKMEHNTLVIIASNKESVHAYNTLIPQHRLNAAPLNLAAVGNQGAGVIIDYKNQKMIAAWTYIPTLNCGLIIKTPYAAVIASLRTLKILWIVLVIIISIMGAILLLRSFFKKQKNLTLRLYMWLIGCIAAGLTGYFAYKTIAVYRTTKRDARNDTAMRNKTIVQDINELFASTQSLGASLAHAYTTGAITKENMAHYISTALKDTPHIQEIIVGYTPYSFDPTIKLYAPTFINNNMVITQGDLAKNHDYITDVYSNWYSAAFNNEQGIWGKTEYHQTTKGLGLVFSIPFYTDTTRTTIRGVIAVIIDYTTIKEIINTINYSTLGYTIIIDSYSNFIYHPDTQYIITHKHFFDLPTIQHTRTGQNLYQTIQQTEAGIIPYTTMNKTPGWLFINTTIKPFYKVLSVLHDNDIPLPYQQLYRLILLCILFCVILLCIVLLFIIHFQSFQITLVHHYSIAYSLLLAGTLALLYYFHQKYSFAQKIHNPLRTMTEVEHYINDAEQKALNNHTAIPEIARTGIILTFLDISQKNYISFSGKVWQLYDKTAPIPQSPHFDQANKETVTEIEHKEYDTNTMIIWWNVTAQLYQTISYMRFPFETIHLAISLSARDSMLRVPDINRYTELIREAHVIPGEKIIPGINLQAEIPGCIVKDAFFSSKTIFSDPHIDTEPLVFNIILHQKIITPLMIYFLPILVILLSVFSVLWIDEIIKRLQKHAWSPNVLTFTTYSGLLFSTIALHREIRTILSSGHILYIEYLFIFIYIAMFTCGIISTIAPYRITIQNEQIEIMSIARVLFWPLLLTFWFIVTFSVFYSA